MIRRSLGMMVVLVFVLALTSVAFARGTPQKAFASKADAVIETIAPTPAVVPVLTGYDVIQNITTERRDSFAQIAVSDPAYTAKRQSTTGDERLTNAMFTSQTSRSSPMLRR